MKKLLFYPFLFAFAATALGQDKPAYILYNKEGKKVKYAKMLKELKASEVLLFGEVHGNLITHWLQLEVSRDLIEAKKGQVTLGAEMFERDNQLLLDEYLGEQISQKNFEDEARLWTNYKTDYKPLVELAKANKRPFIATNIPRRYANRVFRMGLESLDELSEEAKSYIAPLPIEFDPELASYKSMLEMTGGHSGSSQNFPKAQAVKDATMAWSIHQNLPAGHLFIHFNGAFHSDLYEGIYWYLKRYRPEAKISTISTVCQQNIEQLEEENINRADFIICVTEEVCPDY